MQPLKTNRDLYVAVTGLVKERGRDTRSLEEYLRALLGVVEPHRHEATLSPEAFLDALTLAYTAPPVPVSPSWFVSPQAAPASAYDSWRRTLLDQVVDLVEMEKAGTLQNKYRHFGVDSPRGRRWYNFHPGNYLECALAGSLGGWAPGDDSGREFVPGKAATSDDSGDGKAADVPVNLPNLPWKLFEEFLQSGRVYE